MILYGISPSPFVRKVRVLMDIKGINYELEPVIPMNVSDEYKKMHPLGKIPVLKDGDVIIPDSSAICAYLERKVPSPALYPQDAADYARALWFEEYADTKMTEVLVGKIFFAKLVAPKLLGADFDQAAYDKTIDEELPAIFDYLEDQVRGKEFLVGNALSIADISIASTFVNFMHAEEEIDDARWPQLEHYIEKHLSSPVFEKMIDDDHAFWASNAL